MAADVAGGERAEQRVGDRMQADVGVRMADQAERAGQPDAHQHEAVARPQAMDVEAEPGPRLQAAREQQLGAREVGGLRDLEVRLVARDRGGRDARGLGHRDVVGERGTGRRAVRCQDRLVEEALRRLRAVEACALDGAQHLARPHALERIGHRQGGQDGRVAGEAGEHALDQRRLDQRPHAIVDQDHLGRRGGQALEPEPDRILPARAAHRRRQQIEAARRLLVEFAVVGMDHGADGGDARVAAKPLETVAQHRPAGEPLILLRSPGAEPLAATRGHDQGHAPGQGGSPLPLGPAPRRTRPRLRERPLAAKRGEGACRPGRNRLSSARVLGSFA